MPEDPRPRIRAFLARFFKDYALGDDEDMFALGYVNSLVAMQLVQFVEQEFGITVDDADMDMDNFRSIGAIARLVERKTGVAS